MMNSKKVEQRLISAVRMHTDMNRINILDGYLRNSSHDAYMSVRRMINLLNGYVDTKLQTKYNQINRLLDYAYTSSAFKEGRSFKPIPFKYQGLFLQLLIDSYDENSAISTLLASHAPTASMISKVHERVYEIINVFKKNKRQECFFNGVKVFNKYFFTANEAVYTLTAIAIDQENYTEDRKEYYKAIALAAVDNYNDELLMITRSLHINEDDLEDVLDISNDIAYNLNPSPFVFQDSEFESLTTTLFNGQYGILIDSYIDELSEYLYLEAFVNLNSITKLFNESIRTAAKTSKLRAEAKAQIMDFVKRFEKDSVCTDENIRKGIMQEKKNMISEISKSKIAKELLVECCEEEGIELIK